ncbi:methyltransferase domain-containing protein [Nocardioides pacificus]
MHSWDPEHYLAYADERRRPFVELVQRVVPEDPASVVDLGCGPGNLTRLLAERWPQARVRGIDSSTEMIERARWDMAQDDAAEVGSGEIGSGEIGSGEIGSGEIGFEVADLRDWLGEPGPLVDVLVSNATLQWVPGHLDLLPALVRRVTPGGWLAFQVPGNFDEPSHTIRRDLAAEPRFASHTAGVATPDAHDAATYLQALAGLGCRVDAWETTYMHVLTGEDPVFAWVSGTGARPTLQALPDEVRTDFETEFKRRLRAAYPPREHGVVLPFRRVFVVAQAAVPQEGDAA